jgi:hypothetical protein
MPMYRSIGTFSRWALSVTQPEDIRWGRGAPNCLIPGAYVAARRRHTLMILIGSDGGRVAQPSFRRRRLFSSRALPSR